MIWRAKFCNWPKVARTKSIKSKLMKILISLKIESMMWKVSWMAIWKLKFSRYKIYLGRLTNDWTRSRSRMSSTRKTAIRRPRICKTAMSNKAKMLRNCSSLLIRSRRPVAIKTVSKRNLMIWSRTSVQLSRENWRISKTNWKRLRMKPIQTPIK